MILNKIIVTLSLFLFVSGVALADKNGITGRTASNIGCGGSGCHASSANQLTSVTFTSNTGSFTVAPGGKLEITVIIAHPTKSAVGFDAGVKTTLNGSTNAGTITTSGSGTRVANGEITHIAPRIMNNGKAEFTFIWTAPATEGTYFLRTVGNAVNNNGSSDGDDLWNFATPVQLLVKTASSVENSELNPIQLDVFPNPTSDYATVKYEIPSFSEATLEVTDLMGHSFAKQILINAIGTTTIPLKSFPSGEYVIQLRSGTIQQTQKLVIMR